MPFALTGSKGAFHSHPGAPFIAHCEAVCLITLVWSAQRLRLICSGAATGLQLSPCCCTMLFLAPRSSEQLQHSLDIFSTQSPAVFGLYGRT